MSENNENNEKSKYLAQKAYQKRAVTKYSVTCHNVNDYDIIELIENQSNKSDFIKKSFAIISKI